MGSHHLRSLQRGKQPSEEDLSVWGGHPSQLVPSKFPGPEATPCAALSGAAPPLWWSERTELLLCSPEISWTCLRVTSFLPLLRLMSCCTYSGRSSPSVDHDIDKCVMSGPGVEGFKYCKTEVRWFSKRCLLRWSNSAGYGFLWLLWFPPVTWKQVALLLGSDAAGAVYPVCGIQNSLL